MISIIIPTYNRAKSLSKSLQSIQQQINFTNAELIVVDNGSTDNTAVVCKQFIGEHQLPIQYYYDKTPGLLTGRHVGAKVAKGSILCYLDDDVALTSEWQKGVEAAFADLTVQLATGPCMPKFEVEPPHWINAFWDNVYGGKVCGWLSLVELGNEIIEIHPNYIWGLNFCIRTTAFHALKGFHPDSMPQHLQHLQGNGETGLTLKAYAANYKSIYHPQIALFHVVPKERLTIQYFENRAYFQGVCNSFFYLRKEALEGGEINDTSLKAFIITRLIPALQRRLKNLFTNKEILEIRRALDKKEREGFYFHQQAYNNNPVVKQWVLKDDYMNYELPVEEL